MSRSLGKLSIDLVALTGKFETNFKSAVSTLDKFGVAATKVGRVAGGAISKMGGAFASIGKAILSVHAAVVGLIAVVGAVRLANSFDDAAEAVDNLGKKAKTLGLPVETMSALRLLALESGVEFDTLSKMVSKAWKGISEASRTGGGTAAEAFRRMGIQLRDSSGAIRSITELLPEIASGLERLSNQGEKIDLASKIFGREGGTQFVQLLEDSGNFMGALAEQTERARRLGVLFTEDQFQKMKAYRDAVGRIKEAWLGLRVTIMTQIAPVLAEWANKIASVVSAIGKAFVDEDARREVMSGLGMVVAAFGNIVLDAVDLVVLKVGKLIIAGLGAVFENLVPLIAAKALAGGAKFGIGFLDGLAGAFGISSDTLMGLSGMAQGGTFDAIAKAGIGAKSTEDAFLGAMRGIREGMYDFDVDAKQFWSNFLASIDSAEEGVDKIVAVVGEVGKIPGLLAPVTGPPGTPAKDSPFGKFLNGIRGYLDQVADSLDDFEGLGRNVFGELATGLSSGLSSALAKGEASFRNFGKTVREVVVEVFQNVTQMILQFLFMRAIVGAFGAVLPGGGGAGAVPDFAGPSTPTFAAKGGVFGFARGGVAGGVLNGPTGFEFSKKIGVAGEAGPEVGFAPLRKIGGELGVKSVGGDVTVQIIDQRGSGARPEVSHQRGDDGRKLIRVLIRDEVRRGVGEGEYDKVLSASFGLGRRGTKR
ncbi:MAG: phage tail tape measure protein [Deltaproteobacteria bacterium]|nr:MAG: phage tail tape measure protein [Deltaproteobacteria bacterium]